MGSRQSTQKKVKSKFIPRNIIHNFKFPLILEDIGKTGSAEQLADYDFDVNRLMTLAQVGHIKTSKKISNKKYIIDCFSNKQRENILKLVQLRTPGGGYIPIKPRIPEPTTEGVIGPIGKNVGIGELNEKVIEYNRNNPRKSISNIERLKKFQEGTLKETSFVKLTFKCQTLPDSVKLGCNFYPVEANRRDPMLCSKCFRLGHTKNKCHKKYPVCGKCLGPKHEFGEQECPLEKSQWKCINCNIKGHSASWPRCPQKLKLKKALLIQSKHYMPLAAALEVVTGEERLKSDINIKPPTKNHDTRPQTQLSFDSDYPTLSAKHNKGQLWRTYAQTPHWIDSFPIGENANGADGESSSLLKKDDKKSGNEITQTMDENNTDKNGNKNENSNISFEKILKAIQQNNAIMQENLDKAVESLKRDTERKLENITTSLNEIKTQNENRMQMISDFVKNRQQTANHTEKIALDILDSIRQAAEGNPEAIFAVAKKLSKSGQEVGEELKVEIANITHSISI